MLDWSFLRDPQAWRDAVIAGLWFGTTGGVIATADRLARVTTEPGDWSGRCLTTALLTIGGLLGIMTILGMIGILTGPMLLLATCVVVHQLWTRTTARPELSAWQQVTPPDWGFGASLFNAAVWLAAAIFSGHLVYHGLGRFPNDYDCLAYHQPLMVHWLQDQSLYSPGCARWALAANSELLGVWMIAPFSGDFLVGLNNAPCAILWALATWDLTGRLRLGTALRSVVALASVYGVHTLWHETDDASNDLMVVAAACAAASYSLRFLEARRDSDLVLAGISLGLLAGVKYFALGYAAVISSGLILAVMLDFGLFQAVRSALIAGTASLPWCLYWYGRNWVLTGAPLYPMGATDNDHGLTYPDVWSTSFYGNGHPRLLSLGLLAVWKMTGPITWAAVILTPVLLPGLLHRAFRTPQTTTGLPASGWLALAAWTSGSLAVLWVTPFSVEDQPGTLNHLLWAYTPVRYGLTYFSFAVLTFCALVQLLLAWLPKAIRQTSEFVILSLALWQAARRLYLPAEFDFLTAGIVGLDCTCVFGLLTHFIRKGGWARTGIICGMAALPLLGGIGYLSTQWHRGWDNYYASYCHTECLRPLAVQYPFGTRIGVLDQRSYPFFGSNRQHVVWQFRSYQDLPWLERLISERQLSLLVVRRSGNAQIDAHRGAWEALHGNQRYTPIGNGEAFRLFETPRHQFSQSPGVKSK